MPNPIPGNPPTYAELNASLATAGADVLQQKLVLLGAKIKWLSATLLALDENDPAYDGVEHEYDADRNWYDAIENAGTAPDTTGDNDLLAAIQDLDARTAQGQALNTLLGSINALVASFKKA